LKSAKLSMLGIFILIPILELFHQGPQISLTGFWPLSVSAACIWLCRLLYMEGIFNPTIDKRHMVGFTSLALYFLVVSLVHGGGIQSFIWLTPILYFSVIGGAFQSGRMKLEDALRAMVLVSWLMIPTAFLKNYFDDAFLWSWQDLWVRFFGNSNSASELFSLSFISGAILWRSSRRVIYLVHLIVMATLLLWLRSRSCLAGLTFGGLIYLTWGDGRWNRFTRWMPMAAWTCSVGFFFVTFFFRNDQRHVIFNSSWALLKSHLAGIGVNQFEFGILPYFYDMASVRSSLEMLSHPHNDFLSIAISHGILAGLVGIIAWTWMGIALVKKVTERNADNLFLFLSYCFFSWQLMFQFPLNNYFSFLSLVLTVYIFSRLNQRPWKRCALPRWAVVPLIGLTVLIFALLFLETPEDKIARFRLSVLSQEQTCEENIIRRNWQSCMSYLQAQLSEGRIEYVDHHLNDILQWQPNNFAAYREKAYVYFKQGRDRATCGCVLIHNRLFGNLAKGKLNVDMFCRGYDRAYLEKKSDGDLQRSCREGVTY
jgi:hypothetical protein